MPPTTMPGYGHDSPRDTIFVMVLQELRDCLWSRDVEHGYARVLQMAQLMEEMGFHPDVVDAYRQLGGDVCSVATSRLGDELRKKLAANRARRVPPVRARPGRKPNPPLTEDEKQRLRRMYQEAVQALTSPDNPKPNQKDIAAYLKVSEKKLRSIRRQISLP